MGKNYFEGAGLLIGQMLVNGEFPSTMKQHVESAGFSKNKFYEHIRWMIMNGYKVHTRSGMAFVRPCDVVNCQEKVYCSNALERD